MSTSFKVQLCHKCPMLGRSVLALVQPLHLLLACAGDLGGSLQQNWSGSAVWTWTPHLEEMAIPSFFRSHMMLIDWGARPSLSFSVLPPTELSRPWETFGAQCSEADLHSRPALKQGKLQEACMPGLPEDVGWNASSRNSIKDVCWLSGCYSTKRLAIPNCSWLHHKATNKFSPQLCI